MKKVLLFLALASLCVFGYATYFDFSRESVVPESSFQDGSDSLLQDSTSHQDGVVREVAEESSEKTLPPETAVPVERLFTDTFEAAAKMIEETGNSAKSESQDWWVNSGAYLSIENGIGKTVQGELERGSTWQKRYADYNASETDDGTHPQNIFRLVTRSEWRNLQQEAYFKINRYITSRAKERSESNGLLLFNRYQDGDNLYYTGIRVDGAAVIKKKIRGQYFTLAYVPVYPGKYQRKKAPNLLPVGQWIGLRSEVKDEGDGTVSIKVYLDRERTGTWQLVAEAVDDGKQYGGKSFLDAGHAGIRTDFMDVEFDDYRIAEK